MARRRNPPELVRAKWELADRLRTIRTELFGERGLAELAGQVGVPVRTWYSYETGVTVPAEVLLRFVELTLVEPLWLLHGRGPKYQLPLADLVSPTSSGFGEDVDLPGSNGEHEGGYSAFQGFSLRVIAPVAAAERASATGGVDLLELEQPRTGLLTDAISSEPASQRHEWDPPQSRCHCIRMVGNAMEPICCDGAFVAFSENEEDVSALDGKLVVARVDARAVVRWLHRSGNYVLLRAENPAFEPRTQLIDIDGDSAARSIRRVLWVGTAH